MDIQALEARIFTHVDTWRKGNTVHVMAPGFAYMGNGATERDACEDFLVRNGLETRASLMHFGDDNEG